MIVEYAVYNGEPVVMVMMNLDEAKAEAVALNNRNKFNSTKKQFKHLNEYRKLLNTAIINIEAELGNGIEEVMKI